MRSKTILTLIALIVLGLSLACGKTVTSLNTNVSTPSPPAQTPPSDHTTQSGSLVDGALSGDISYELAGLEEGNSANMNLKVRNKTERIWELKIEVGTKLEPAEGDVQQMVVTKEIEVHLEPHEEKSLELEVSCLDISKAAPSQLNSRWQIEDAPNLAQFIRCANQAIDSLTGAENMNDELRRDLIQGALWKARGASQEEWIKFYEEYQHKTEEEARQEIAKDEIELGRITSRCPSL